MFSWVGGFEIVEDTVLIVSEYLDFRFSVVIFSNFASVTVLSFIITWKISTYHDAVH